MREVAALAIGGILIGVPLVYALASAMSSQLYGVRARDTAIYSGATVVILLACFAAALLPALRAARVDPKAALRYE